MICICNVCIKSSKVKKMMQQIKNGEIGECIVCGKDGIDIQNETTIAQEFANQIRYYYSGIDYIQDPLPIFASANNFLLVHKICEDKAKKVMEWLYANTDLNSFEVFVCSKQDTPIPLHKQISYESHMKLPLREASSALIEHLKEDIKKYNYYKIEDKYR